MYHKKDIQRMQARINLLLDAASAVAEEFSEWKSNIHHGSSSVQLTPREVWLWEKIRDQVHPLFRCDILRPRDIIRALTWVDPNVKNQLTEASVGKMMGRIGRFYRRKVAVNNRHYRMWILRDFDRYLTWTASEFYKEYERQLRDNVPPGVEEFTERPSTAPLPNDDVSFM